MGNNNFEYLGIDVRITRILEMDLNEIACNVVDWILLAQIRNHW